MHNKSIPFKLKPLNVVWATLLLLGIFDGLFYLTHSSIHWLQVILGLPILFFMPGFLSIYLLGAKKANLKAGLFAVTLSVLELMLVGLACNYVPSWFGSSRPLNSVAIFIGFNIMILFLATLVFLQRKRQSEFSVELPHLNLYDYFVSASMFLTLLLAVFGAFRLNNGGSNIVSMASLLAGLLTLIFVVHLRRKLSNLTFVLTIFSLGLAVLLMTSLRSWDITGHDIKSEYMVYTLTNEFAKWNINNYRNAYNACLSITILPIVIAKLLHTTGYVVFKLIFQVLFAASPLIIYEFARKFLNQILAFLGAIIFIAYPTFTTDSAMLTRQEIAFLFFGMVILVWFSHTDEWLKNKWRAMFLIMSTGIILSHYSTTYMFVILILIVYFSSLAYKFLQRPHSSETPNLFMLTGKLVMIVFLVAFFWYAQTTNVSSGFTGTIKNSIVNIPNLFNQDNRALATNDVLIGVNVNAGRQLLDYVGQTKSPLFTDNQAAYNSINFANDYIGPSLVQQKTHINFSGLMGDAYYGLLPRSYQLLAIVGIALLIFNRKVRKKISALSVEFTLLCVAALFVLGLQVLLPNISLDYGLLRAFQQCLFFFIIPILLALQVVFDKIIPKYTVTIAALYAFALFVVYTGFITQLTGGIPAPLALNNNGPYYGQYYAHETDLAAFKWLGANINTKTLVHANNFSSAFAHDPHYPFHLQGILPFQLSPDDSVLLQYDQVVQHIDYITVEGELLPVEYNPSFLSTKDLIYNNGGSTYYN